MGRTSLAATSLVAAVPAGVLAYVTIMAFVNYADAMPTMMLVVNGAAVTIAVLLAITPVAILVGKRGEKQEKETPAAEATEDGEESDAAESAAHTAEVVTDDLDGGELSDEMDLDELAVAAETDSFEFDMDDLDEGPSSADEAFEFDDEDDELK